MDNDISLRFQQGRRLRIPLGLTEVTMDEAKQLTRSQRKRLRSMGIFVPYLPQGGTRPGAERPHHYYKKDRTWERAMRAFNIEHEGNRLADNAESASDALLRLLRQHHPKLINSYPGS